MPYPTLPVACGAAHGGQSLSPWLVANFLLSCELLAQYCTFEFVKTPKDGSSGFGINLAI